MRILLISNDSLLQSIVTKFESNSDTSLLLYDKNPNPLEVASYCFSNKPSVLIVDDDFLTPNTLQVLESIRKVNNSMKIIFVTSDASIELGKKISPLGIFYYAIKPIEESDFTELLESVLKTKSNQFNHPL
jgi:response regulator of citrate/malate metabolism